jgi:hypothetical protein
MPPPPRRPLPAPAAPAPAQLCIKLSAAVIGRVRAERTASGTSSSVGRREEGTCCCSRSAVRGRSRLALPSSATGSYLMREAIRWQSVGNPLAIRWQLGGNQVAIRWQSGGNPVAIRALSSSATGSYSKRARTNWGQSSGNQVAIKWQSGGNQVAIRAARTRREHDHAPQGARARPVPS